MQLSFILRQMLMTLVEIVSNAIKQHEAVLSPV